MLTEDTVRRMNRAADRVIARVMAQIARDEEQRLPSCRKGCGWCCFEPVQVDRREAIVALRVMGKLLVEVQEESLKRIREVSGKVLEWSKRHPGWQDNPAWVMSYRKLRAPCPFLNLRDHSCRIYADRPFSCRTHLAVKPSSHCEKDELREEQQFISIDPLIAEILTESGDPEGAPEFSLFPVILQHEIDILCLEATHD